MTKETVIIQRRWSWLAALSVEIDCDPALPPRVKLGLAVKVAHRTRADLTDAVLTGAVLTDAVLTRAVLTRAVLTDADLTDADLTDADLTDADLTDADLTDAVLTDADLTDAVLTDAVLTGVPKIENIHQAVYAAASVAGALDMSDWHTKHGCKTAHCRAGWVTTLAGDEGARLEAKIGPSGAAALIYLASDPTLGRVPDFFCGNTAALADMKRLAEAEAAKNG